MGVAHWEPCSILLQNGFGFFCCLFSSRGLGFDYSWFIDRFLLLLRLCRIYLVVLIAVFEMVEAIADMKRMVIFSVVRVLFLFPLDGIALKSFTYLFGYGLSGIIWLFD